MISFERLDVQKANWEEIYGVGEINVFQTYEWLELIAETLNAEPVVAVIRSDGNLLGYFTGLIVRKYGLRILGSPFRGWGTYFMGFNLRPGVSREKVLKDFPKFAFDDLGCHYLEIVDPNFTMDGENVKPFPYKVETLHWYAFDLTQSEDELLAKMTRSHRQNIRHSIRNCTVAVEEATDIGFMDEYYAQFTEVMNKQSMEPVYDISYLKNLYKRFFPTGNLMLLRARDSSGLCIASQIVLGMNKVAIGWGAASWRNHQCLHPNEALIWYCIEHMKARGMRILHVGCQAENFKTWMGCASIDLLRIKKAKYAPLDFLLNLVTSPQNNNYRNWMLRVFNS